MIYQFPARRRTVPDDADENAAVKQDFAATLVDGIQSKIDAADGAIVSVFAANGAVVLFAIDKIKELERVKEHTATHLIISSTGIWLLGYLVGLFWPLRADQFSPSSFLKRATFEPATAMSEATSDLADALATTKRCFSRSGL